MILWSQVRVNSDNIKLLLAKIYFLFFFHISCIDKNTWIFLLNFSDMPAVIDNNLPFPQRNTLLEIFNFIFIFVNLSSIFCIPRHGDNFFLLIFFSHQRTRNKFLLFICHSKYKGVRYTFKVWCFCLFLHSNYSKNIKYYKTLWVNG